jgi:hypothetical protein
VGGLFGVTMQIGAGLIVRHDDFFVRHTADVILRSRALARRLEGWPHAPNLSFFEADPS